MRVARRSADPFVRLVSGAATVWLCGQAVINIGYVTALLPVTGIPLPFISAGGTSLLASFFVLGMLVSFARHEAPAVIDGPARRAARPTLTIAALAAHPRARSLTNHRSGDRRPPAAHPASSARAPQAARAAACRAAQRTRRASQRSTPHRAPLRATGTDGQRRAR